MREGGNLWSTLPEDIEVYPDILERAGYHVGLTGKGWGPGDFRPGGRTRNPAGPSMASFDTFLAGVPRGKPFCYWFGSTDPHRPYEKGTGRSSGIDVDKVRVPAWLPDHPEVRSDIADYFFEVQRFDSDVGRILKSLEAAGQRDNTLFVVTSDNGMPFPRAKTNLYDSGTRMPLVVMWPKRIPAGRLVDDMVSFTDLAPTFLEAAGLPVPAGVTGRSLIPVLTAKTNGRIARYRSRVFFGRERHTNRSVGAVGYPMRALRTYDYLYIRNFMPDRWPAGSPPNFGDIDDSPTKQLLLENREKREFTRLFELACGKRPSEELYDLQADPNQLSNIAGDPENERLLASVRARLDRRLVETDDPRATGGEAIWDTAPYYGDGNRSQERK